MTLSEQERQIRDMTTRFADEVIRPAAAELATCGLAIESPVDLQLFEVDPAVPSGRFSAQRRQVLDTSLPQALARV